VNRDTGPIPLSVEVDGFHPSGAVEEWTLGADVPWAANTLNHPEAIKPSTSAAAIQNGKLELELEPFGIVRLRIPAQR